MSRAAVSRAAVAAVAVAAVLAVSGCGGDESTSPGTTEPPASATTVETETTETTVAETQTTETLPATPKPTTIVIVVAQGQPQDGIERPSVKKGNRVRLRVRSDVADEVHLHGYDLSANVAAGGSATIAFTADVAGRFEIELEGSGVQIAELTVTP